MIYIKYLLSARFVYYKYSNMSPFDFNDYRSFLNATCEHHTALRGYKAALARSAGCQASYFSQALKGKVHLTEDQLMGVALHLKLPPYQIDHLLLQLRFEKAGTEKLKNHLKNAIKDSKERNLDLQNRVAADQQIENPEILARYLATWIPSTIHILTSSENFQTAEAIAKRLCLPSAKVTESLHFLEKIGFVERTSKGWKYKGGNIHLPKNSPLQPNLQLIRRDLAGRSIALNSQENIHFSSLFTIDEADFMKLKDLFANAIEKSHRLIERSGTAQLTCMCIDLFEVT